MSRYFSIFFLVLSIVAVSAPLNAQSISKKTTPVSEKRVRFLINEMTINKERQQKALDEIALSSDDVLRYLPRYFSDRRHVASKDILFLNTWPGAFEKYFFTEATTIDEVAMQYFCWRTMRCEPTLDPRKLERTREKYSGKFK